MSYNLDSIRILMGVRNAHVRNMYRSGLFRSGLRGIEDCSSAVRAFEILGARNFDLIILDADMEDSDVISAIRLLRERKLGKDPFANVILIADPPTSEKACRLITAGADAILIRPISVELLQKKILQLFETRHPFVVTHDYIGPERRTEPRHGSMPISSHLVPSSLKDRAFGKTDENQHFKEVEKTWCTLKKERIACLIYQIGWLINYFFQRLGKHDVGESNKKWIKLFLFAVMSLENWMVDEVNEDFSSIYSQIKEKANSISQTEIHAQLDLLKSVRNDIIKLDILWKKQANLL
jgi:DNA-binding response OmpR family regulator